MSESPYSYNLAKGITINRGKADEGQTIKARDGGDLKLEAEGTGKVKIGDAGIAMPDSDGSDGQVLVTDGAGALSFADSGLTVKQSSGSPSVANVSTIQFDDGSSGFNISDEGSGVVEISLGSHWKELQIDGQSSLIPDGEENLEVEAGSGISLSTNTSASPKILTIAATTNALADLSNVASTSPTDGQALIWDNTNSTWEPGAVDGGGGGWDDSTSGKVVQETIADEVGIGVAAGDIDANSKLTVSAPGIALKTSVASAADPTSTDGYAKLFGRQYIDPSAATYVYNFNNNYNDANGGSHWTATNSSVPPTLSSTNKKFGSHALDFGIGWSSSGTSARGLKMADPLLGTGAFCIELFLFHAANSDHTRRRSLNKCLLVTADDNSSAGNNGGFQIQWQGNWGRFAVTIDGAQYQWGYGNNSSDPKLWDDSSNTSWGGKALPDAWAHLAVTRYADGTLLLWMNGHKHPKTSNSTQASANGNANGLLLLGTFGTQPTNNSNNIKSGVDDLNIYKGSVPARYSASSSTYVVPTVQSPSSLSDELWAQGGGVATKISPHNTKGEWEFNSYDSRSKVRTIINTEEALRDLQALTGKTYIKKIQE